MAARFKTKRHKPRPKAMLHEAADGRARARHPLPRD